MADYLVQEEDGTSKVTLEEGGGSVLLEESTDFAPSRVYQDPVEVIVQPDTAKARIYQDPVEVIALPDTAQARVYQLPVEVLVGVSHGIAFHVFIID